MEKLKEKNKTLYFALFLGGTVFFVTLIAFIGYNITNPIIEANNQQRITDNIELLFSSEEGFVPNTDLDSNSKYAVKNYDRITDIYEVFYEGEVYAVIYNVWEQGKNDKINTLVAIDPYTDTILGVVLYKHGETPNLGALYAEKESTSFMIGQNILGEVEVDAISGATVTWGALNVLYETVKQHYTDEEVHIDG